jgi:hypothetical protein
MKLTSILKEFVLKEVGEATASTYKFEFTRSRYPRIRAVFDSQAGQYEVTFIQSNAYISEDNKVMDDDDEKFDNISYDESLKYQREGLLVSFRIVDGVYDDLTNKNELYKVMATILAIMKAVEQKRKPAYYKFQPSKQSDNDDRRLNLYLAYIKNNMGSEFVVDITDPTDYAWRGKIVFLIRK